MKESCLKNRFWLSKVWSRYDAFDNQNHKKMIDLLPGDARIIYLFVVDTNRYAGNFERDLCAYITGVTRDGDPTGKEYVSEERRYTVLFIQHPDRDYESETPVVILPTPGWYNNGLGFEFQDGEEATAVAAYNSELAKEHRHNRKGNRKENITITTLKKHPAYMSVGICLGEKPNKEDCKVLFKRAKKFFKGHRQDVNVSGYRVLKARAVVLGQSDDICEL